MSTFIQEQFENYETPLENVPKKKKKKIKLMPIICSGTSKRIVFVIFFALLIPALIYYLMFDYGSFPEVSQFSCLADEGFKVPCGKINISAQDCFNVNCCFNLTTRICYHYLPSMYYYEVQSNGTHTPSQKTSPFGSPSVENVQISLVEKDTSTFSIVLHDSSEVVKSNTVKNKNYSIHVSNQPLSVHATDKDNDTILTTIYGPLIASDFYWEWTFLLTNETLFGLDRNAINLTGNETLTKVIYKNKNDHVTLPVFWAFQKQKFHGLVINHDGPLELTVLPSNLIILKSIAGKKIELEVFLGPTPSDLHQRMAREVIVPPLWTLGTHICRRSSDTNLEKLLSDYVSDNLTKFDTDCIHENLFFAITNSSLEIESFANVTGILEDILESGTKFLLNMPPQIWANESNPLYKTSKELGLLLQHNNTDYHGKYLNKKVVYPDFSHPSIGEYVKTLIQFVSEKIGLDKISGLVLNDNWPEDDAYPQANGSGLPYFSQDLENSMSYTLPWNVLSSDNLTYHMVHHNSYGTSQNQSLFNYLQNLENYRELVIISATKTYGDVEPAISENFNTSWANFREYLQRTLFYSITGNLLVGLPVCGDTQYYNKEQQETLCLRWYLAASTMPYFRVSSVKPFRDPHSLESKFATRYALLAIERRKLLQEHYYTILSRGEPIVRPMYYDYYENTTTFFMTSQYTVGKNLIVAHPLSSNRYKLQVYLPKVVGIWYEFWGGNLYNTTDQKDEYVDISLVETDWISFVAQGTIVPLTRNSAVNLTVALNCAVPSCTATGELYKDQNYLQFWANLTTLTISNLPETCDYTLEYIHLYWYNSTSSVQQRIDKSETDLCAIDKRDDKGSIVIFYGEVPEENTTEITELVM